MKYSININAKIHKEKKNYNCKINNKNERIIIYLHWNNIAAI